MQHRGTNRGSGHEFHWRRFLTCLPWLAGVLAGCSVGPDYVPPETPAPTAWASPLQAGQTDSAPWGSAWWQSFNDPELDSLISRAIAANHDLRIAQSRVREARGQYRVTRGAEGPTLDASASYARQLQSRNQPVIGSLPLPEDVPFENNVYRTGFDASWEVDLFGGNQRATEAGYAEVEAARFSRRNVLVTLLAEVARNYVDLRGNQQRLELAHKTIRLQESALKIAQERLTNGLTDITEMQDASTRLADSKAAVPVLEIGIQSSIYRLDRLLGLQPGTLQNELTTPAAIPTHPPRVPVGLPSELLLRRPDIQQAAQELAAATARIGVATAELFPKFSLTGMAGYTSISASDWFTGNSQFWSLGPTVQWRLFQSGSIRANIEVQNARQEQALAAYEAVVLRSFEEVEIALITYAKAQVRRQALEDSAQSRQDSLDLARQLHENGLADLTRVLKAEYSVCEAMDSLTQNTHAIALDLIVLYKALGGGWENVDDLDPAPLDRPDRERVKSPEGGDPAGPGASPSNQATAP